MKYLSYYIISLLFFIFNNQLLSQDVIKGCTNPMAKNYNRDATQDDGSCEFYYSNIKGCTNPLAKNYDRNATQDDGSCIFEDESKLEKKLTGTDG